MAPIQDIGSNVILAISGVIRHECCCVAGCLTDIKERQQAYGITTAWDSGDPYNTSKLIDDSGDTTYTLTQLKAYVNAIATKFISGTYTGGASAPTMLSSSYADSATDVDELCALVLAMLSTKETSSSYTATADRDDGSGSAGTREAAIAAAEADYSPNYYGGSYNLAVNYVYNTYQALIDCCRLQYQTTGLSTDLSKSVRTFGLVSAWGTFDDQGKGVSLGYNLFDTTDAGAGASITTGYFIPSGMPDAWGPTGTWFGFRVNTDIFAIVDWSFTNTP